MNGSKKVLLIAAIVLVIATFIGTALVISSNGFLSEIYYQKMTSEVEVKNGVCQTDPLVMDLGEVKDGDYTFRYSWSVPEPSHVTGIVIKDSKGNVLCQSTGHSSSEELTMHLDEGSYTAEFIFMANEDEMRSFFADNAPDMTAEEIDSAVAESNLGDISPRSLFFFSCELSILKTVIFPASANIAVIVICALTLLVLFLILRKAPADGELAGRLQAVGPAYAFFATVTTTVQSVAILISKQYLQSLEAGHVVLVTLLMIVISVDVIGFASLYLVIKKVPKEAPSVNKLSIGKFIKYVFISAALVFIGTIIGTYFHLLFSGSPALDGMANLMSGNIFVRALVIGIIAPIVEELIFRKILVDRTRKYGEFTAILLSGLMFGLFHGNFSQFFFATLLGFFWAYIYLRTGKVIYTIILHMLMNLTSSVITATLATGYTEAISKYASNINEIMEDTEALTKVGIYAIWMIFLGVIALIGLIIAIVSLVKRQFKINRQEGELSFKEQAKIILTSPYMWLFYIAGIGLFVSAYLPGLISA